MKSPSFSQTLLAFIKVFYLYRLIPLAKEICTLLADILFPPYCPSCNAKTTLAYDLCMRCWSHMRIISNPICHICGAPLPLDSSVYPSGSLTHKPLACGQCIRKKPLCAGIRSAVEYHFPADTLVLRLKYGKNGYIIPVMGKWLEYAFDTLPNPDLIEGLIPVPLHWKRFLFRGFNQSVLMAYQISSYRHIPVYNRALRKVKHTKPQTGMTAKKRRENIKKAFAVPQRKAGKIQGKHLLLIDDVFTTGSTLDACAKALIHAGAASVSAITFARTVKR